MATYEIRKEGKIYAQWEHPAFTPPPEILRTMKAAGYRLYINGKLQR